MSDKPLCVWICGQYRVRVGRDIVCEYEDDLHVVAIYIRCSCKVQVCVVLISQRDECDDYSMIPVKGSERHWEQ